MSVDVLQELIRKKKNPSILYMDAICQWMPPHLAAQEDFYGALRLYCKELLQALCDVIPAVRFGFSSFALRGPEGLRVLQEAMSFAKEQGYYVLMDLPEMLTATAAENAAECIKDFSCDGVVVNAYLGSDVLTQLRSLCQRGKTVFAVCRTANRSASELQDLLTGGRLVHAAAADVVWRYAEPVVGKCGYSQLGAVAAASSAQSTQTLRSKFPKLFLLLDGYDYTNANAKNCSEAFDRFGHGAAACASSSILAAWKEGESDGTDYLAQAEQAALRMKKNLTRYVNIL